MPAPELLLIRSTEGEFPVAEVHAYLDGQPFLLRDSSGLYLLCGTASNTQYAREQLLNEPGEPYPPAVLVRIGAAEIQLWQRASDAALAQARDFAGWIRDTYRCRIVTPEGADYTDRLDTAYE